MIKLTGGNLKGRSIKSLPGSTTRPSSSKVREAIFNIIGGRVTGSSWLDLFGGSGAVGLEALSRGADGVTFIEKDAGALNCLKKNISLFNLTDKVRLFRQDALTFLKNKPESYSFVFLDPPYQSDYYEKVFSLINKNPAILKPDGVLIVEHRTKIILPDIVLIMKKSYKYGDTSVTLYCSEG
jgi:16S rRNA (guanine966-N2)-methyltransferase